MNIPTRFSGVFLITLIAVSAVSAQDLLVVETNLVTLNVSVTDKKGDYVRNLSKDDFVVLDNGKPRQMDVFSAEESALSIGVVYDLHSTNDDRTTSVLDALKRFTGRLSASDDYFISIFNEKGTLTTQAVPDADQIRRHLSSGPANSPTSLFDAVFAASKRVSQLKNAKRYLLIVTDGNDKSSEHSPKELEQQLRAVNVPVYVLRFTPENRELYGYSDISRNGPRQSLGVSETSELDRAVLDEISKTSGGQALQSGIRNRVYLAALATKLLEEARSQYVLGFYPEINDGKWHKLSIQLKSGTKGLKVTSRKGYQAPVGPTR